jgi:hypothetical protein
MANPATRSADLKIGLLGLGAGLVWIVIIGSFAYWLAMRGVEHEEEETHTSVRAIPSAVSSAGSSANFSGLRAAMA